METPPRPLPMNLPGASLRRLVPSDARAYRALMLEAYGLYPEAFTSSVAEREQLPTEFWAARLAADVPGAPARELVIGAWIGEVLAGVAGLSFETRDKVRHKANLFGMVVQAQFRGHKLGKQLVDAALNEARNRPGVRLVQLTVTQGNGVAQALYRGCGFVEFGLEPLAVALSDGFVSKLHMWREV